MAVYTDVAAEELAEFLAGYDIGTLLSYKGIAEGVENSNFLVHTSHGSFILTLYEKRVAAKDLPFFLGLMEHLASRGITCPQPVKNRQGDMLGTVAGRPAAIITFLEGLWIRRPSATHCARLGTALARLHLAGQDFPLRRTNALSVAGWRQLYEHCAARAHEVRPDLGGFLAKELADYMAVRPLAVQERAVLPMLARGAALRFLLTRLTDWFDVPPGALVRPKDPMEYFRKLRFHQQVKSVRDYGIDA